jgi:hypothetical protein
MWRVFLNRFAVFAIKLAVDYVVEKAKKLKNAGVEVVFLSVEDNSLMLEFKYMTAKFDLNNNSVIAARTALAQNTIIRLGPYQLTKQPITYVLVPKLSLFSIGFKTFRKYIKDWKGDSLFGELPVIKYRTFWSF